jgi:DNA-binding PadR family transcriptional regulator
MPLTMSQMPEWASLHENGHPLALAITGHAWWKAWDEQTKDFDPDDRARAAGFFDVPVAQRLEDIPRVAKAIKDRQGMQLERARAQSDDLASWLQTHTPLGLVAPGVQGSISRGAAGALGFHDPAPPEKLVDLPVVGKVDPLQTATTVGAMLAPNVGMFKALQGARAFASVPTAVGQGIATRATAGMGAETMRWAGSTLLGGDADWREIPIAGITFGAGGVPTGRILAAGTQGLASSLAQKMFHGTVDSNRVIMETAFAGIFGNPSLKQLRMERARATGMSQAPGVKEVEAKAARDLTDKVVKQYLEAGDKGKAAWIDSMKKFPDEALDLIARANPEAEAAVRDIRAAKNGETLLAPEGPPPSKIPSHAVAENPLNLRGQIGMLMSRAEGPVTTQMIADGIPGIDKDQIHRAMRGLVDKGRVSKSGPRGGKLYSLTDEGLEVVQKKWSYQEALESDLSKQAAENAPRMTTEMPADKRAALAQEHERLVQVLEDIEGVSAQSLDQFSPGQRKDLIDYMIGGRRFSELKDLSDLPPEWMPYKNEIENAIVRAEIVKPSDLKTQKLMNALEESQRIRDDIDFEYPLRGPLELDEKGVRDMAAKLGMEIQNITSPSGKVSGYRITRSKGRALGKDHKSWDSVKKQIERIGQGKVDSVEEMMTVAKIKGYRVTSAGKGKWSLTNLGDGEAATMPYDDAVKTIQDAPLSDVHGATVEDLGLKALIGGSDYTGSDGWRIPDDLLAKPDAKGTALHALTEAILPVRSLMSKMDDMHNLRLNEKIFEPVHVSNAKQNSWLQLAKKEDLESVVKHVKRDRQTILHEALLNGKSSLKDPKFGLSGGEQIALTRLRNFWAKHLNIKENELDDFFEGGIGKVRSVQDQIETTPDGTIKAPDYVHQALMDGRLDIMSTDPIANAIGLLRARAHSNFMQGPLQQARSYIAHLDKMQKGDTPSRGLSQAARVSRLYLDTIEHRTHDVVRNVAEKWKGVEGTLKKLGMLKGDELTPKELERIFTAVSSGYSGAVMSARAAMVVRNLTQSFLAAPKVGLANVLGGWKDGYKAWRDGSLAKLQKAGVINEPAFFGQSELEARDLTLLQGGVGKPIETVVRKLLSAGMYGFRKADTWNRIASYYAGRRAILKNIDLLKTDIDEFRIESGLAGDSRTLQRRIFQMLQKGQHEQAADLYGAHVSRTTQFMYSNADVGTVGNPVGRMASQFSVWPIQFADYINTNLGITGGKGFYGQPKAFLKEWASLGEYARTTEQRYQAKFATNLLGQIAALTGVGMLTGFDLSSWNRANPFSYEGGPFLQSMGNLVSLALMADPDYKRSMSKAALIRTATSIMPFSGALTDVSEAIFALQEGVSPLKALGILLGFRALKE